MSQNPALIGTYLRDAWPEPAAVKALHGFWLQWRAEVAEEIVKLEDERARDQATASNDEEPEAERRVRERWIERGAPPHFDVLLRAFFDRIGRAIFASPDPLAAIHDLWEEKPRRPGRHKEDNAGRNVDIVAAVRRYINDTGASQDKAIRQIAQEVNLSYDSVKKIFYEDDNRQLDARLKITRVRDLKN